jgi:hypothetical protein
MQEREEKAGGTGEGSLASKRGRRTFIYMFSEHKYANMIQKGGVKLKQWANKG